MKFALLSSLPSATIQLVYHAQTRGVTFEDVVFVGPDSPQNEILREYSRVKGFTLYFVDDPNASTCVETVKRIAPDLMAQIGSIILRPPILEVPRYGVLNLHAGWLPDYRGLDSPQWAVLEGGKLGVTAHLIDAGIDTGPILARRELALLPGDTVEEIMSRNHHRNKWQTLVDAMIGLRDGTLKPEAQRPGTGKQYFAIHPKLDNLVREILRQRKSQSEKAA